MSISHLHILGVNGMLQKYPPPVALEKNTLESSFVWPGHPCVKLLRIRETEQKNYSSISIQNGNLIKIYRFSKGNRNLFYFE